MANARTIKTQITKAGLNINEWDVEKGYGVYYITFKDWGISDSERQSMTGDEVNAKRQNDKEVIEQMADLFENT